MASDRVRLAIALAGFLVVVAVWVIVNSGGGTGKRAPRTSSASTPASTQTAAAAATQTTTAPTVTTPAGPLGHGIKPSAAASRALAARLVVARRFSVAYMPYQIGRLSRSVRVTIEQTCTPAFARFLLQNPVRLPPSLLAHPKDIEVYRVANVNPGPGDEIAVNFVSEQLSSDTGAFLLSMTSAHGRWLVSALHA